MTWSRSPFRVPRSQHSTGWERHVVAPRARVYRSACRHTLGAPRMSFSRRELLSASALLLAGPGLALRAAAQEAPGKPPAVMCWNENPYGPSPAARQAVSRSIAEGCRYPSDEEIAALVAALADHEGVTPDHIVTGTGSGELLRALGLLCAGGELVAAQPTYGELPEY